MKPRLLLATRNPGKAAEMAQIIGDLGFSIVDLREYPEIPITEETGDSFWANAIQKARLACAATGSISLADDSGLEVRALSGAPGIYSNRFAGPHASDRQKNEAILNLLKDVPDEERNAEFVCVVALATPNGEVYTSEGRCSGFITRAIIGGNGFGYDPIFYVPDEGKTFAQIETARKNRLSHRAKALMGIRPYLEKVKSDCGGRGWLIANRGAE